MFFNYIKFAVRNIFRNKTFSFVNIAGLAFGLAGSFIVSIYVIYELSFDRHHDDFKNIYRLTMESSYFNSKGPQTLGPLANAMREAIPEVKYSCRSSIKQWATFGDSENEMKLRELVFADPEIGNIFNLPLYKGDLKTILEDPSNIVISDEMLKILPGDKKIGDIIIIKQKGKEFRFKLAGILKHSSRPSTFHAEIIVPFQMFEKWMSPFWEKYGITLEDWSNTTPVFHTYVKLKNNINSELVNEKINKLVEPYFDLKNKQGDYNFILTNLNDLHFYSGDFVSDFWIPKGDINNVIIYSIVAFMILFSALINYVNLTIAQTTSRMKELGIRKVNGAGWKEIFSQQLVETLIYLTVSAALAFCLLEILFPHITPLLGNSINNEYLKNPEIILIVLSIYLLVAFVAGTFVALSYSRHSFTELLIQKDRLSRNHSFRSILIAVQVVIFVGVITSSAIIYKQMEYTHTFDMGFNKEGLVYIMNSLEGKEDIIINELKNIPGVIGVAATGTKIPTNGYTVEVQSLRDEQNIRMSCFHPDYTFLELMGVELISGRFFSSEYSQENFSVILNETVCRELNYEKPLLEEIKILGRTYKVIGIVKDFKITSLREKMGPMAIRHTGNFHKIYLKINPNVFFNTIEQVKKEFLKITGQTLNYDLVDDAINDLYLEELKFQKSIAFFTILSVIIAGLGLFGLTLNSAIKKSKEIGIRKILGASSIKIFSIVTRKMLFIILVGSLVATPVTYYLLGFWLDNFAYKIEREPVLFLGSILMAFLIGTVAIGGVALKVATSNPVDALRDE